MSVSVFVSCCVHSTIFLVKIVVLVLSFSELVNCWVLSKLYLSKVDGFLSVCVVNLFWVYNIFCCLFNRRLLYSMFIRVYSRCRNLLLLGRERIMASSSESTKHSWCWRNSDWWNSMWTMDHAPSYRSLLREVSFLIQWLGVLDHCLEIIETSVGISMCLGLHVFVCLSVLIPFSMYRASLDHHLLSLNVLLTLIDVLLLYLVHHHLVLCLIHKTMLLLISWLLVIVVCWIGSSFSLPLEWFYLEVFFLSMTIGYRWLGEETIIFPRGSRVNREWIHNWLSFLVKATYDVFFDDDVSLYSVWLAILLWNTTWTHKVRRAWSWHAISTAKAMWSTSSRKVIVPIAEWWNVWQVIRSCCCFALVVASVKNTVPIARFTAC